MSAYEISLLTLVGIHVMLALSLNLITGFCGQISLGHAAFYGVGAYTAALLAKAGFWMWATLPASVVAAGAAGLLVGFCSLRVRDDFLAIATMGAGFLFIGIVRQNDALGGELGISRIPDPGLEAGGFLALVLLFTLLVIAFCVYLKRSWLGFAFDAVAADEAAAQTIGVSVADYKLSAFALGTALAGLAGGLYAYYLRSVGIEAFGFPVSILILAMVVIGGMGSIAGSVVAAVLLTLLPEWFHFISDYKLLVFGGLLFAIMRFAPGGLAGWAADLLAALKSRT